MRLRWPMILTLIALVALVRAAGQSGTLPITPAEHRRGGDQTFLTYPEWFLVYSSAEYADFVQTHTPDEFPFIGHTRQFWQSYAAVRQATRQFPYNGEYHTMINVIGGSTTLEYGLRSAYETLIGRLTALSADAASSQEDKFGAAIARDYVRFIRAQPWYEYDFFGALKRLWRETDLSGNNLLRKWERKYALTTEYLGKGIYGWLIKKATRASFERPVESTVALVEKFPAAIEGGDPEVKLLQRNADDTALLSLPRYHAFTPASLALARQGIHFSEIAGNRGEILLTVVAPESWRAPGPPPLFVQPIMTQPGRKRVALSVPVAELARTLNELNVPGVELEHVYDY